MIHRVTVGKPTTTLPAQPMPPQSWLALLTMFCAAIALGIGVTTPPRSGPGCITTPCITYPYTDAAAFVPSDYIWMYPAVLLALSFPLLVIYIQYHAALDKKIFGQIAFFFAALSAIALVADYAMQLLVLQPSLALGEAQGLGLWTQYNPHGVFIALENIGYLMMSIAFLFSALALNVTDGMGSLLRWLFILDFVATMGALGFFIWQYGMFIEYRFEVAAIGINWLVLIVSGIPLSLYFRQMLSPRLPSL